MRVWGAEMGRGTAVDTEPLKVGLPGCLARGSRGPVARACWCQSGELGQTSAGPDSRWMGVQLRQGLEDLQDPALRKSEEQLLVCTSVLGQTVGCFRGYAAGWGGLAGPGAPLRCHSLSCGWRN